MLFASPASPAIHPFWLKEKVRGEISQDSLQPPSVRRTRPTDLHLPQEFMGCPVQKRIEAARIMGRETEKGKIIQSSDYFGTAITHAHLIRGVSPMTIPIDHDGKGLHLCCALILPVRGPNLALVGCSGA